MFGQFNLDEFIAGITGRRESLLQADLDAHRDTLARRIEGRSVLAIGAAGTIGAAFVKALLPFRPERVVVVDINENGLTELVRDCRSTWKLPVPDTFITYPVRFDDPVFARILAAHGPFDIVANFAAHKHVRSEKDLFSVEAMLENNVFRARDLLAQLATTPPEHFFCVSTDKAANPVNVMGASKKMMEDLIMAWRYRLPVTTARFANVAFSNGSLLQGFLERLLRGQPLSAPSDVRRYFVSPTESGQICMLACLLGEPGEILFPKLDSASDTRTFAEIGSNLLRTLGLEPVECATEEEARQRATQRKAGDREYPVYYFSSDTTGEKPEEEFVAEGEEADLERFSALGVIRAPGERPGRSAADLDRTIASLRTYLASPDADKAGIVERLSGYLGNFRHVETGRNLDQRM